jgi:hypothetical protein
MLLRTIMVAEKTLDAIDAAMAADGGASFRQWQGKVMPTLDDAYRGEDEPHRGHLGASLVGRDCAREIWYAFRWVHKGTPEPRMLRLYNRGHLEEGRFIALLLMLGLEVWQVDETGKQFRISWADGHAGGSGDGVARGIPDLPPTTPALTEFKTHGEKSFIKLAGKLDEWRAYRKGKGQFTGEGLRISKFEHFVQMQTYMRKMGLAAGIYFAVNKNTDDIYAEVIHLDSEFADQFLSRGEQLVQMPGPPKRINESPGFFKCRFCDRHPVCHMGVPPDKNCRTCRFSSPGPEGTWNCSRHNIVLERSLQLTGCTNYEVSPFL